jgi:perosamine synthetase
MHDNFIEKNLQRFYSDYFINQTSSGTSALICILAALKNKKKNEVIIPSVVCPSILFAVNFLSLKPIFVDMEKIFFNMDVGSIRKKISKNTLAIICVHCYGIAANIPAVSKIAKKSKIFMIEDACLNFGGKINGQYYGSFGDASVLSFGYDKILSEKGGALLVKNKRLNLIIKKFLKKNTVFNDIKINKKSFVRKLETLDENIYIRNKNAKYLNDNLTLKNLIKPKFRASDVYWRYPLLYKGSRENMIRKAKRKKIIITSHYPALNKFQYNSELKNAELFNDSVLNIFVRDKNSQKYLDNVCHLLNK